MSTKQQGVAPPGDNGSRRAASDGKTMATVLLVDDEPSVTQGVKSVLRRAPFEILAAHSTDSAFDLLRSRTIDVVVSDECMPTMRGTEFLAQVRTEFPSVARIMLTGQATLDVATKAINEGQIAFLLQKPCPSEQLANAIIKALGGPDGRGRIARSGYDNDSVARRFPRRDFEQLSPREKEVLFLVVDGQRPAQIAKALFISEHTVRNHLKMIFGKLDVHSQTDLMQIGRGTGRRK